MLLRRANNSAGCYWPKVDVGFSRISLKASQVIDSSLPAAQQAAAVTEN
jgi:hypothetical protein